MKELVHTYRLQFKDKHYVISLALSFLLLAVSLTLNLYAATYADHRTSNAVSDIVLSNIPTFNVYSMFVYGPIIFWLIIAGFCVKNPQKIPFMLKSIALFIITRSIFISLTHIGPYPDRVIIDALESPWMSLFSKDSTFFLMSSGGDLFFSAHTGLPFLIALVFWKTRWIRFFGILSAIFFGIVVLLGHLHYSIDVMAAFFITYTIFHISEKLFPADLKLFET